MVFTNEVYNRFFGSFRYFVYVYGVIEIYFCLKWKYFWNFLFYVVRICLLEVWYWIVGVCYYLYVLFIENFVILALRNLGFDYNLIIIGYKILDVFSSCCYGFVIVFLIIFNMNFCFMMFLWNFCFYFLLISS